MSSLSRSESCMEFFFFFFGRMVVLVGGRGLKGCLCGAAGSRFRALHPRKCHVAQERCRVSEDTVTGATLLIHEFTFVWGDFNYVVLVNTSCLYAVLLKLM